jgi:hypothetical protein
MEDHPMRRVLLLSGTALTLIVALIGCSKQTEDSATLASSDSLLSANPVEQPQGSISPSTDYQAPPPEPQQQAPAVSPPPRKSPRPAPTPTPAPSREPVDRGVTLAAGTPIEVAVSTQISSETAHAGDSWTGEVKQAVIVGDRVVIPAGSTVTGVVAGSLAAETGNRAMLLLEVRSVNANGKTIAVEAPTDSIIAGSPRARNIGAVAGGAAAGALIGKAVGGGKGALIGGLVGGAAATGAVAKSKGYQVVVKEGTVLTFTVQRSVNVTSSLSARSGAAMSQRRP